MNNDEITSQLTLWSGPAVESVRLINLSENHTFEIACVEGTRRLLRVHRQGYQNRAGIEAELEWIAALERDTSLHVPRALAGDNGELVQLVSMVKGKPASFAVLFEYKPGAEPDANAKTLPELFRQLGKMAAQCHAHVRLWDRAPHLQRPVWTVENMLSTDGLWGDWRVAPNLAPSGRDVLERAFARLKQEFSEYGHDQNKYGLIHADMRLANVLIDGDLVRLIDFDDCGFGWFVYDFAAAVSFFEDAPNIPVLRQNWLAGYAEDGALAPHDLAMIDAAILLRRMLLLAWIGSHAETDLARFHAQNFAAGTVDLAQKYLRGEALS